MTESFAIKHIRGSYSSNKQVCSPQYSMVKQSKYIKQFEIGMKVQILYKNNITDNNSGNNIIDQQSRYQTKVK